MKVLPRQPGTKESRYSHLLAGDVVVAETETAPANAPAAPASQHGQDGDRLAALEEEVAGLRRELAEMKDQWERFRRQFE